MSLRLLVESGELRALLAQPPREDAAVSGRQRRLNEVQVDQLALDYGAGLSVCALASKYGIDRGVVAQHLKHRGVALRPTLLQPEVDRALELYAAGHVPNKIGQLLHRDPKTIRALLRRQGLLA